MELVYRGIKYQNDKSKFYNLIRNQNLVLLYYKRIIHKNQPKFPLKKYCQQLFSKRKPAVLSPAKFWQRHQIQLLENCWQLDIIMMLNLCWQATIIIEMERSLTYGNSTQLKYRGVSYYKSNIN